MLLSHGEEFLVDAVALIYATPTADGVVLPRSVARLSVCPGRPSNRIGGVFLPQRIEGQGYPETPNAIS